MKNKLKKTKENQKKKNAVESPRLLNQIGTMAIGSLNVDKKGTLVRISKEYLKNAIAILDILGAETVTLYIETDFPLGIGEYDEKKKKIAGMF